MVVANGAHARIPRIYQQPRQSDYTTRPKSKSHPLNLLTVKRFCAGFLVLALALLVVFRYGQISQINMDINQGTKDLNVLVDEQRHLKIKIAELTGLERLEQIALGELGMHYPHPDQFKYVGKKYPESGGGDGD